MRLALILSTLFLVLIGLAAPASAYSYSAAGAEPLIDGREALLGAVGKGDWDAAGKALAAMQADIDYLDQNDDKGIAKAFSDAVAAKDAAALQKALMRAYADEIERRLRGAKDNLSDYQTAKVLVVRAQRFYTAMAGDLAPEIRTGVEGDLKRALDAIGNPGVFGVGARKPDPAAFEKAHQDVKKALESVGR